MLAPKGAVALLRVYGRADGVDEITFACEDGTRKMVIQVSAGPTLLMKMWGALDLTMDKLMAEKDNFEKERQKIRARAQAEFIALFMTPHFTTADGVAVEAKRRYNARQEGTPEYDPEYETPGLGSRRYQPPPGTPWRSKPEMETRRPTKKAARKPAGRTLKPDEIAGIKNAIASGAFTEQQCADMFKVTVAEVKRALSA